MWEFLLDPINLPKKTEPEQAYSKTREYSAPQKTNPMLFRIFWGLLEETPVVMIDTLHLFPESYEHVLNVTKRYPKM